MVRNMTQRSRYRASVDEAVAELIQASASPVSVAVLDRATREWHDIAGECADDLTDPEMLIHATRSHVAAVISELTCLVHGPQEGGKAVVFVNNFFQHVALIVTHMLEDKFAVNETFDVDEGTKH